MNSVRSGFNITMGLLTFPVKLYAVSPSESGKGLRTLCQKHEVPIKQAFVCPTDNELNPVTVKAFERTKDVFTLPDTALEPIPKDSGIDLKAVSTADLEAHTIPGEQMYYLQAAGAALPAWEVIFRLAQLKDRTLIAQTALRDNGRKLYRVTTFHDTLALQEMRFPEKVRKPESVEHPTVGRDLLALAKQVLDTVTLSWDDLDTVDEGQRRFDEYVATGKVTAAPESSGAVGTPMDLMEALKQSVAKVKATK